MWTRSMSSSEGISPVIRMISTPTSARSIERRPRPISFPMTTTASSSETFRGNNVNSGS